jgi:hypothetical protein
MGVEAVVVGALGAAGALFAHLRGTRAAHVDETKVLIDSLIANRLADASELDRLRAHLRECEEREEHLRQARGM